MRFAKLGFVPLEIHLFHRQMEDDQGPKPQQTDGIQLQRAYLRQFTCCNHGDGSRYAKYSADNNQLAADHKQRTTGTLPFAPEVKANHAHYRRGQKTVGAGFKPDTAKDYSERFADGVQGGL